MDLKEMTGSYRKRNHCRFCYENNYSKGMYKSPIVEFKKQLESEQERINQSEPISIEVDKTKLENEVAVQIKE